MEVFKSGSSDLATPKSAFFTSRQEQNVMTGTLLLVIPWAQYQCPRKTPAISHERINRGPFFNTNQIYCSAHGAFGTMPMEHGVTVLKQNVFRNVWTRGEDGRLAKVRTNVGPIIFRCWRCEEILRNKRLGRDLNWTRYGYRDHDFDCWKHRGYNGGKRYVEK